MSTYTFIVRGPRTHFPIDMLRYDCCWPDGTDDANMIGQILDDNRRGALPGRVSIKLRTEERMAPTVALWESYGWSLA